MSLLWRTAAWWSRDPDEMHEYEEGLRDPEEPGKARGQRYVSQVVDRHNVDRGAAEKAIKHVLQHHQEGNDVGASPEEYGFATSAAQWKHYPMEMTQKLMDPKTWRGKKVEQVPLDQPIHATQNFIHPRAVAHNLFHPGKRTAEEGEAIGDPDYDPNWDSEQREESDRESDREFGLSPEERELRKNVFFMKRKSGRMEVVDGHHRVATDMLLGKSHTPGIVIHEKEIR
jgi:hypothetical protein